MQTIRQQKYCQYVDFFHYFWFIDSGNLFYSNFERNNYKALTLNIVHFTNLIHL